MSRATLRAALVAALALLPAAADAQAPARWTLTEELRIGREDAPEYALSPVRHLAVAPDGSIFVGQAQAGQVRVFDAQGRFLRAIGRRGDGPGELRSLGALGLRADTLWAADRNRIHFFTLAGESIATLPLELATGRPELAVQHVDHLFADGSFGIVPSYVPRSDLDRYEDPPVLRLDRDGGYIALGTIDLSILAGFRHEGRLRASPVAFAVYGAVGWDPNGRFAVLLRQAVPEPRDSAAFTLTMVTSTADTVWSRAYPFVPVSVPESVRDSVHEVRSTSHRRAQTAPALIRAIEEAAPVPRAYPPVHAIFVGADGSIWLGLQGPAQDRWRVLNPDGTPVAEVTVGPRTMLHAATGTHVWGVQRDGLDVPRVMRWRIVAR